MTTIDTNLSYAQELNGGLPLSSFDKYDQFFAQKIEVCSRIAKIAWVIVKVVSSIFLYPVFLIENIYCSVDLPGKFFFIPIESYHHYFVQKVETSSGLIKTAWIIGAIISGIFAYPTLGGIALIGLALKLPDIPAVWKWNDNVRLSLELMESGLENSTNYRSVRDGEVFVPDTLKVYKTFFVPKNDCKAGFKKIYAAVQKCNWEFKRVIVQSKAGNPGLSNSIICILMVNS